MKKLLLTLLAFLFVSLPFAAYAWQGHQHTHNDSHQGTHNHGSHGSDSPGTGSGTGNGGQPPVVTPTPSPVPPPPVTPPVVGGIGTVVFAYNSAYGFPDNSCGNDGTDRVVAGDCTSINGIDGHAGGDGTYANPLTVAVGYVGSKADYAPGTIFYRTDLEKYGVAGDTCFECHSQLNGAKIHIDWYAGGTAANTDSESDPLIKCEEAHDLNENIIISPPNNLPVKEGPIYSAATGCAQ